MYILRHPPLWEKWKLNKRDKKKKRRLSYQRESSSTSPTFDGLLHNSATSGRVRTVRCGPDFGLMGRRTLGFFMRLDWWADRRFRLPGHRGLTDINSVPSNVWPFLEVDFNRPVQQNVGNLPGLPSGHQWITNVNGPTRNDHGQGPCMLVKAAFLLVLALVQTLVMLIILWLPVEASRQIVLNLAAMQEESQLVSLKHDQSALLSSKEVPWLDLGRFSGSSRVLASRSSLNSRWSRFHADDTVTMSCAGIRILWRIFGICDPFAGLRGCLARRTGSWASRQWSSSQWSSIWTRMGTWSSNRLLRGTLHWAWTDRLRRCAMLGVALPMASSVPAFVVSKVLAMSIASSRLARPYPLPKSFPRT